MQGGPSDGCAAVRALVDFEGGKYILALLFLTCKAAPQLCCDTRGKDVTDVSQK